MNTTEKICIYIKIYTKNVDLNIFYNKYSFKYANIHYYYFLTLYTYYLYQHTVLFILIFHSSAHIYESIKTQIIL